MSAGSLPPTSTIESQCGDPAIWKKAVAEMRLKISNRIAGRSYEIATALAAELRVPLQLEIAWPSGLEREMRTVIEAQVRTSLECALIQYHIMVAPKLICAIGRTGREVIEMLRVAGAIA